ncbi:hypothetical protein BvCmsJ77A_00951 [Escherichia coli]|nr:hypothetical protein BvCmsJ77A_00951 [Escherichia coli]
MPYPDCSEGTTVRFAAYQSPVSAIHNQAHQEPDHQALPPRVQAFRHSHGKQPVRPPGCPAPFYTHPSLTEPLQTLSGRRRKAAHAAAAATLSRPGGFPVDWPVVKRSYPPSALPAVPVAGLTGLQHSASPVFLPQAPVRGQTSDRYPQFRRFSLPSVVCPGALSAPYLLHAKSDYPSEHVQTRH